MEDVSTEYVMVSTPDYYYMEQQQLQRQEEQQQQQLEHQHQTSSPQPTDSSSTFTSTSYEWWNRLHSFAGRAAGDTWNWIERRSSPYNNHPAPLRKKANTIHANYDWVSDTIIDEHGGRLILPGPLIVMDQTTTTATSSTPQTPQQQQQYRRSSSSTATAGAAAGATPSSPSTRSYYPSFLQKSLSFG